MSGYIAVQRKDWKMAELPMLRQVPSPNYSPAPIAHDLFIFHMMEGGYAGSVAWLCRAATQASAHLCMRKDGGEVTQLVPLNCKAWAECNFNGRGISLEDRRLYRPGHERTDDARCGADRRLVLPHLPACRPSGRRAARAAG